MSLKGTLILVSATGKVPPTILDREYKEIAAFEGDTLDELDKLVAFHLKAGNYDDADIYSRKSLILADSQFEQCFGAGRLPSFV